MIKCLLVVGKDFKVEKSVTGGGITTLKAGSWFFYLSLGGLPKWLGQNVYFEAFVIVVEV